LLQHWQNKGGIHYLSHCNCIAYLHARKIQKGRLLSVYQPFDI